MNSSNHHYCKSMKVESHSQSNSNAITITVEQKHPLNETDMTVDNSFTFFGLPTETTDALIKALGMVKR